MAHIAEVIHVEIKILKSNPPQWSITAIGKVPSAGWRNPQLAPRFYIDFPEDGILDLDFLADPPEGIVLQPVTPIVASTLWSDPASSVRGVRVHSRTNNVVATAERADTLDF